MMAKIMKENSQVLQRSTYGALTKNEWEREECKNERSSFMEFLCQVMGLHMRLRDFIDPSVKETPHYDLYKDELQNAETFLIMDEEPEVTSK